MSILLDKIKLFMKISGKNLPEFFKNNSMFFFEKYKKSDKDVTSVTTSQIFMGGFYFLHYKDDSNWMKYSPIFTVAHKKFSDFDILFGINFNFIPLELRAQIFAPYITENDFKNNNLLKIDYEGVYRQLYKFGFEYAIVEYNVSQIVTAHRINMDIVPMFLYSSWPGNKYDPNKLYQIWKTKISTKSDRHEEMTKSVLNDFYDINNEIKSEYIELSDHIKRLRKSVEKFG